MMIPYSQLCIYLHSVHDQGAKAWQVEKRLDGHRHCRVCNVEVLQPLQA